MAGSRRGVARCGEFGAVRVADGKLQTEFDTRQARGSRWWGRGKRWGTKSYVIGDKHSTQIPFLYNLGIGR